MRLFEAALDTLSTAPSPQPSQFTVCTSRFARQKKNKGERNKTKLKQVKMPKGLDAACDPAGLRTPERLGLQLMADNH